MINFLPWRQQRINRQRRQHLLLLTFCLFSNTMLLFFYYTILQPRQRTLIRKLNGEKLIQQQQRQSYQHYCHNKKNLAKLLKNISYQKKFIDQFKKILTWEHYHFIITTITLQKNQTSVKGIIPYQQWHNFRIVLTQSNSPWQITKQNRQPDDRINLALYLHKQTGAYHD